MSLILDWYISAETEKKVVKYCHQCKSKVVFRDSGVIRRNANGKHIYEFAIYKCEKDHTWNNKLGIYKPKAYKDDLSYLEQNQVKASEDVDQMHVEPNQMLEIKIRSANGNNRLDKILSERLIYRSRAFWQNGIRDGQIVVNNVKVKRTYKLKEGDVIQIERM